MKINGASKKKYLKKYSYEKKVTILKSYYLKRVLLCIYCTHGFLHNTWMTFGLSEKIIMVPVHPRTKCPK